MRFRTFSVVLAALLILDTGVIPTPAYSDEEPQAEPQTVPQFAETDYNRDPPAEAAPQEQPPQEEHSDAEHL